MNGSLIVLPYNALSASAEIMSVLRYVLGSTNTVLRSIHGTEDIETAAIHIALGKATPK